MTQLNYNLKWADIQPEDYVLVIGIGNGYDKIVTIANRKGAVVRGIDISEENINLIKEKMRRFSESVNAEGSYFGGELARQFAPAGFYMAGDASQSILGSYSKIIISTLSGFKYPSDAVSNASKALIKKGILLINLENKGFLSMMKKMLRKNGLIVTRCRESDGVLIEARK